MNGNTTLDELLALPKIAWPYTEKARWDAFQHAIEPFKVGSLPSESGASSDPRANSLQDPFYCTSWTLVKQNREKVTISPMWCKNFGCIRCGPIRKDRLRNQIASGNPKRFLTLTVNPNHFYTPAQAAQELRKAWFNIRRAIKRRWKINKVEFISVFETTENGWPHLHTLFRGRFIPVRWLSNMARHYLHSPIVDVRRIKNKRQLNHYVTKYCCKQPQRYRGCKRYWSSHGYSLEPWQKEKQPDPLRSAYYPLARPTHIVKAAFNRLGYLSADERFPLQFTWSKPNPPPSLPFLPDNADFQRQVKRVLR